MDPITLLILAGIGIAAAMLARKRSRPPAPPPGTVLATLTLVNETGGEQAAGHAINAEAVVGAPIRPEELP